MKKTIFITGSTDGIGKLTATKLASEGNVVFIHGRSKEKLQTTITEIKQITNNQNIDGFVADLSDLPAVKVLANEIKNNISSLDVLINNAGVYVSSIATNNVGIDMRFAVNYLAPYVLTNALLPILKNSNSGRVINLSSAAQAPVDLNALNGDKPLTENAAYAQSKLALTIWSFNLAASEPNLVVIPVNPGSLLNTNMVKKAFGKSWSSADKGADILSYLATSENYKNDSGKYFDNDQGSFGNAHADAYDETKIQELLDVTEQILA